DRPFVEYRAPRDLYTVSPADAPAPDAALRGRDPIDDLATWTSGAKTEELGVAVTSSLMASGKLAQATRWLGSLTSRDPSRSAPLLTRLSQATEEERRRTLLDDARRALIENRDGDARRMLDNLLRQWPRWAPAMIERGRVAMRSDSLVAARALLE